MVISYTHSLCIRLAARNQPLFELRQPQDIVEVDPSSDRLDQSRNTLHIGYSIMRIFSISVLILAGIALFAAYSALYQPTSPEETALACNPDNTEACFNAGFQYANGKGVAKDLTLATKLFVKACDGGDAIGCFYAGLQYDSKQGVAQDLTLATEFFMRACDSGYVAGCVNAGIQFHKGRGVGRDQTLATHLFMKACAAGDARGCNNAGPVLSQGD